MHRLASALAPVPGIATLAMVAAAFVQGQGPQFHSTGIGDPHVIITEIMYNPASKEVRGETEWIEIANAGREAVEIKGWRLDDEDTGEWGAFDCTLAPGAVAVLVNAAAIDELKFRQAWDEPPSLGAAVSYQIIPITWASLANSPSADNESIRLVNAEGEVVCEVNLQAGGDWPEVTNDDGCSIWLTDVHAPDLSNGKFWRKSAVGVEGARQCTPGEVFDMADIGSPGYVPGLSAAPPHAPDPPQKPEIEDGEKDDKSGSGSGKIDF